MKRKTEKQEGKDELRREYDLPRLKGASEANTRRGIGQARIKKQIPRVQPMHAKPGCVGTADARDDSGAGRTG